MRIEQQKAAWNVLQTFTDKPFAWDRQADCCAFVNAMLKAFFGRDFMGDFQYSNKVGAFRAMRKYGGLVGAISHVFGESQPAVLCSIRDGDVLAAQQNDGEWIVGICFRDMMAVKSKDDVMSWPLEAAVYMWRPV